MRQVYDSERIQYLLNSYSEEVSQPLLAMHHYGLIEIWEDECRICMVKSTQKMEDFNAKLKTGMSPEELVAVLVEYIPQNEGDQYDR